MQLGDKDGGRLPRLWAPDESHNSDFAVAELRSKHLGHVGPEY